MANIVITVSGNSVVAAFNVYSTAVGADKKSYNKNDIAEVTLGSGFVEVMMKDAHAHNVWMLTYDSAYGGDERYIVDTVAGVAPASESDLFDKITALRG